MRRRKGRGKALKNARISMRKKKDTGGEMLRIQGDVFMSFFRLDGLEMFLSGEVTFKLRCE